MARKKTFESALLKLEDLIDKIENNDISLEDSVKLYKEGIELAAYCSDCLKKTEQEITVLQKSAEGIFSQKPFDVTEE